jgi:hypothetical protein
VSATNLNCWALGPAYYQSLEETNPECLVCGESVTNEQFCEGCGSSICDSHTHNFNHVAHCRWCFDDARKGRV